MRRETNEDLYQTILENLRGFDLAELEDLSARALRRHFEVAARAFSRLDENLQAGGELPLDWQRVTDDAPARMVADRGSPGEATVRRN